MNTPSLGKLLAAEGLITSSDWNTIERACGNRPIEIIKGINALGIISELQLARLLASKSKKQLLDTELITVFDQEVLEFFDPVLMQRLEVIPLKELDLSRIQVAVANPFDRSLIRQIEFFTGRKVEVVVTTPTRIHDCLSEIIEGFEPKTGQFESFISQVASQELSAPVSGTPSPAAEPNLNQDSFLDSVAGEENLAPAVFKKLEDSSGSETDFEEISFEDDENTGETELDFGSFDDVNLDLPDIAGDENEPTESEVELSTEEPDDLLAAMEQGDSVETPETEGVLDKDQIDSLLSGIEGGDDTSVDAKADDVAESTDDMSALLKDAESDSASENPIDLLGDEESANNPTEEIGSSDSLDLTESEAVADAPVSTTDLEKELTSDNSAEDTDLLADGELDLSSDLLDETESEISTDLDTEMTAKADEPASSGLEDSRNSETIETPDSAGEDDLLAGIEGASVDFDTYSDVTPEESAEGLMDESDDEILTTAESPDLNDLVDTPQIDSTGDKLTEVSRDPAREMFLNTAHVGSLNLALLQIKLSGEIAEASRLFREALQPLFHSSVVFRINEQGEVEKLNYWQGKETMDLDEGLREGLKQLNQQLKTGWNGADAAHKDKTPWEMTTDAFLWQPTKIGPVIWLAGNEDWERVTQGIRNTAIELLKQYIVHLENFYDATE